MMLQPGGVGGNCSRRSGWEMPQGDPLLLTKEGAAHCEGTRVRPGYPTSL